MKEENGVVSFRCHPFILLENMWQGLAMLALILLGYVDEIGSIIKEEKTTFRDFLEVSWVLIPIIIVLGIIIFVVVRRWQKTTFTLNDTTLVIERDTINKKINTIGLKNISNVNMEQNLIEMAFGISKVKLDTNSLSTAQTTDVKILLKTEEANQFKNLVISHMNQQKAATDGNPSLEIEEEYASFKKEKVQDSIYMEDIAGDDYDVIVPYKDIFLHSIYSTPVFSIIFVLALLVVIIVGVVNAHVGNSIVEVAKDGFGSLFAILLFVYSIVQSLFKDFIRLYGFRIKRTPERLYISYGLLKKQKFAIPVDKINAIIISQPTISRWIGKYQVQIINVGSGEDDTKRAQLVTACTRTQCMAAIKRLLPEFYDGVDDETVKQDKCYWKYILVRFALFFAGIGVVIASLELISETRSFMYSVIGDMSKEIGSFYAWLIIIGVLLLFIVIGVVSSIGSYMTREIGVGKNYLTIVDGCFAKQTTLLRYGKIQYMNMQQGLSARTIKRHTCVFHILAPIMLSVYSSGLFTKEVYESIHEKMTKHKSYEDSAIIVKDEQVEKE